MLSIGIVGLPNVGKSTLFQALTKKQVDISNYPFTTIDPNVGVVAVPDERVDALAEISKSAKKIYTTIEFIDIAGLVRGAAQGEGLGNKFLANIREVDAIAEVVRVFEDENITHVHKRIDPADDIEIIRTELELADLETKEKRDKKQDTKDKQKDLPPLDLLAGKKIIYIFNVSEKQLKEKWTPKNLESLDEKKNPSLSFHHDRSNLIASENNNYVVLSAPFELLLSEAAPEEQKIYLTEIGLEESGLDKLVKQCYQTLGLITFLTTGEDETRAWTTKRGTLIPQAARAIHTDFEKRFIRAEVINWQELLAIGSWPAARQTGKIKTVGKDYAVLDGDVVEIKI